MARSAVQFPEILDCLRNSVIATTLEGVVTDCNFAAEKIYGYSRAELIGKHISFLYPEDQLPLIRQLMATAVSSEIADGELLTRTRDGKLIFVHLSLSLINDDRNAPCGLIGVAIDTTERRRKRDAQRETDDMYRAARSAARVGTWHWDLKTDRFSCDEQCSILLDLPPNAEVNSELFMSRIHQDDRVRVAEDIRRCVESAQAFFAEYRVVGDNGTIRWLSGRGRCLRDADGVPARFLGVATDVTDRKEAEIELQKTQAKYRAIFDSSIIGVASGNLERVTDANDALCRMIGYAREDLLSGSIRWQEITPQEYLERDHICLQEMINTGVGAPYEKEFIRSDGKRVRVLLGSALISRDPLEWSCFVLDVTRQHRALSTVRLSEQVASAARLGSALAHELNNPLAGLTNILYLLRFGAAGTRSEELLLSAQEALDRTTRITRQMIGVYSDSSTISEFTFGDLLEDTLATFATRCRGKSLSIQKRNHMPEHMVRGIEGDFRRLISTLVENAVECTQAGGTLQLHLYPAHEWRGEKRRGLRIVVRDNGPGISRERLSTLFEPFYSTKSGRGTGLGLWSSRNIVEKHGGTVSVRSSTKAGSSGTCISVFLPERSEQHSVELAA